MDHLWGSVLVICDSQMQILQARGEPSSSMMLVCGFLRIINSTKRYNKVQTTRGWDGRERKWKGRQLFFKNWTITAVLKLTSFRTHWFPLMKDNLEVFVVKKEGSSLIQSAQSIHTHTRNLMCLLSMQSNSSTTRVLLPKTCFSLSNPAVVSPCLRLRALAWCNVF